jgi:viroplasmin and RNaseH domain-containing protein
MPKKNNYYAYIVPAGAKTVSGITNSWAACEKFVSGKPAARFKGFVSRTEAEQWLHAGARYEVKIAPKLLPGIYFDAGTGRGNGVEISVTDEKGKNLLHDTVAREALNKFGKHLVEDPSATNNYGELLALRHALTIAKKNDIKKVFGDSKLVIDYWSQWKMKRKELPEATVELADEVSHMREEFESAGGLVTRISGDHNPADLGFHR